MNNPNLITSSSPLSASTDPSSEAILRRVEERAGVRSRTANPQAEALNAQPSSPRRVNFLGCPLDLLTSAVLLDELAKNIDTRAGARVIQFVNANKIAQVRDDAEMGRIMWHADYALADGQPLLPMARLLGLRIPERIDGIGLMGKLLRLANERRYTVFLLGAKQNVVEACVDRIRREYREVRIAGFRNGYFSTAEIPAIVQQVRESRPDILFLGMGSPMKERFADRYADQLGAAVIQGVGGSFDVMAGLITRAPGWIQRLGFEWLYRVLQEPRRMAWRYAKTNAQCLWVFGRATLSRRRSVALTADH